MALDALDLLLVADCAWIWVRSKIRDPPEASTRRDHPCLCSAVSPQSVYSTKGWLLLPALIVYYLGLEDSPQSAFSLSSALTWACFVDVLRGVSQAIPSMPARSHFGEVRLNLPSGYSLGLCFKPVEQEAL
ncbi:hypothetical protein Bca4012_026150 [Brassica carinata]